MLILLPVHLLKEGRSVKEIVLEEPETLLAS